MTVKLVLAGHSHVHALGVPGRAGKQQLALVPLKHPKVDVAAVVGARDATYWDAFVDASAAHVPAVIWSGNQHYAHFLFRPTPAIDFVLSAVPQLPINRTAQIVPEEMIRAFLAPSITGLHELLLRLQDRSPFPAIVIGTPPPKGDLERLCANVDSEPVLKEAARRLDVPIVPASLTELRTMVKLWRLLQTILAEAAAAVGAAFVPVPPRLITSEGTLSDNHWGADATHANRAYGGEMLGEVVREAQTRASRITSRTA